MLTRRSWPDALRFPQSSGPNPGAKATLSRLEGFLGGWVVAIGARRDDELFGGGTPIWRVPRLGIGGGGINAESVSIVGILDPLDESNEDEGSAAARCALFIAGKAGGASSSPAVSDPSSSSSSLNDPGTESDSFG
jgi:hypothetical protein